MGATQAPYPLGTRVLLPVGEVLLEKVALSAPRVLASSAEHPVGKPGREQVHAGQGQIERTWVNSRIQNWGPGFLLHLLVKVDALGAEDTTVGRGWGLETGTETGERPKGGKV